MAIERTLIIVKPDAVAKGTAGRIISRFEEAGLRILAARMVHLSKEQAAGFYVVHKERPFYSSLCAFMTSGPCLPMALEGDGAIALARELMGATDPAQAAPGTIRKEFESYVRPLDVGRSVASATSSGLFSAKTWPQWGAPAATRISGQSFESIPSEAATVKPSPWASRIVHRLHSNRRRVLCTASRTMMSFERYELMRREISPSVASLRLYSTERLKWRTFSIATAAWAAMPFTRCRSFSLYVRSGVSVSR